MKRLMMVLALLPATLQAQEGHPPARGLVLDEGVWEEPTPAMALRVLAANQDMYSRNPAVAVLRQTFEPRSSAELEAFTDQLAQLMIEGDEETGREAALVLLSAEDDEDPDIAGTPYPGAVDAFIRVYEAQEDKASDEAWNAMAYISWSKGGVEYILETFNGAEVPPRCLPHASPDPESEIPAEDPCQPRSEWCSAGLYLFGTRHAPNEEEYDARCIKKW